MGIKEIADRAGVSQTAVSLALNGRKGVSDKTRQRIIEIAQEQEYRVPAQRDLSSSSKGVVIFAKVFKHGLILNKDQNVFILDYINGINPVITNSGFSFEILDQQVSDVKAFVEQMNKRDPKGIIFLGTEHVEEDIKQLSGLNMPYIVMDSYYDYINTQFVDMNNAQGVYDIISYLFEAGHRNISMISSEPTTSNLRIRENQFRKFLERFRLSPDGSIIPVAPGFDGAYRDMKNWLTGRDTLPDALFCYNDVAAYGAIKALKEQGFRVPEDVSIVGFDNLPTSAMIEPHLTTIAVPKNRIGEIAGETILDRIRHPRGVENTTILVNVELIIRDSVMRKKS